MARAYVKCKDLTPFFFLRPPSSKLLAAALPPAPCLRRRVVLLSCCQEFCALRIMRNPESRMITMLMEVRAQDKFHAAFALELSNSMHTKSNAAIRTC